MKTSSWLISKTAWLKRWNFFKEKWKISRPLKLRQKMQLRTSKRSWRKRSVSIRQEWKPSQQRREVRVASAMSWPNSKKRCFKRQKGSSSIITVSSPKSKTMNKSRNSYCQKSRSGFRLQRQKFKRSSRPLRVARSTKERRKTRPAYVRRRLRYRRRRLAPSLSCCK